MAKRRAKIPTTLTGLLLLLASYWFYTYVDVRPVPPEITTTVNRAVDGDTLEVTVRGSKEKVRLLGIDTPETVDPRKPVQCFGKEASDAMKKLVTGREVRLVADPTQDDRDTYDRLLRYVYLTDGTFVNEYMVKEGYAHAYVFANNPGQFADAFRRDERAAREAGKGLWAPGVCP